MRGLHRTENAVDDACFLALDAGHVEQFEALTVRIELVAVCVEGVVGTARADNLAVRERREAVEHRMRLRLLGFERLKGSLRAVELRIEQRTLSRVRRRKFPLPLHGTRELEFLWWLAEQPHELLPGGRGPLLRLNRKTQPIQFLLERFEIRVELRVTFGGLRALRVERRAACLDRLRARRQRCFADAELGLLRAKRGARLGLRSLLQQNAQGFDDRRLARVRFAIERDGKRVPARVPLQVLYSLRKIVMDRSDEIHDLLHRACDARVRRIEFELPEQIVDFVQYDLV
ncbi:hypothetical protein ABIC51_005414 [Burkholderia sp. 572]